MICHQYDLDNDMVDADADTGTDYTDYDMMIILYIALPRKIKNKE